MKIRTGFVSNSSSSSFIVGVPAHSSTSFETRMRVFEDVVKEWEYEDTSKLPFVKPFSYEICKRMAEEDGYQFALVQPEFGCEAVIELVEKIGGFVAVDMDY